MGRVRGLLTLSVLLGVCALLASGCGSGAKQAAAASAAAVAPAKPTCPGPAGWQALANRIKAPVYCPGWLPDPLIGRIGGVWNNINSVSPDRSYLESFVWQETGAGAAGGELHVNLRAYPGVHQDPHVPHRRRRLEERAVLRAADDLGDERTASGPACTRSTRMRTSGMRRSSGARTAISTRSPSTSRRR